MYGPAIWASKERKDTKKLEGECVAFAVGGPSPELLQIEMLLQSALLFPCF